MTNKLLEVKNLKTSFRILDDYHAAVDDVTLTVNKNEVLAIVGESGSGKSAFAFSLMGLHTRAKIEGNIFYKGEDIANAPAGRMSKLRGKEMGMIFQDSLSALNPLILAPAGRISKLRGKEMGMIFQDSLSALNPLMNIGKQIEEVLLLHDSKMSKSRRKERAIELLGLMEIPRPEQTYYQYPHELSGGMRQRVVIAIAVANEPELLIADEPTTALDVTIQMQIFDLLKKLKNEINAGIILITHDLGVVAEMADRVAVMYAGQIVEVADVYTLFENPLHPYTRSLLNSIPHTEDIQSKLHVIQGIVPSLQNLPRVGCRFKSRIPWIDDSAHEENPSMHEITPGHFVRCTCHNHFHFPEHVNKGGKDDGVS